MTTDLVLYFPADDVPESVFQGIYNNNPGSAWFGGFPWHNYDKIDEAWTVMNRQARIWVAHESDPIATVVYQTVGTSASKKVDSALIDAIEAALTSLQPIERNDAIELIDTLQRHLSDRVCAVYE